MTIELNKTYSLITVDSGTFYHVKECTDMLYKYNIHDREFLRKDIIKGFREYLDKFKEEHQMFCIKVLGKGRERLFLTPKGNEFRYIPINWVSYKNYGGGKNFTSVRDSKDMFNCLSLNRERLAVASFNSALKALGEFQCAFLILNKSL